MSRTVVHVLLGVALLTVLAIPALVLLLSVEEQIDCMTGGPGGSLGGAGGSGIDYTGPGLEGLDATQTGHAAAVVGRGQEMGVPREAMVIALAVVSQESRFTMYANDGEGDDLGPDQRDVDQSLQLPHDAVGTDHGSVGLFQQQYPWWGTLEELMDAPTSATKFYDALLAIPDWKSLPLTVAAQRVQSSGFPDAYADDEPLARRLVDALLGAGTTTTTSTTTSPGATAGVGAGVAAGVVAGVHAGDDPYGLGEVQPQLSALVEVLAPMFGITTVGGYRTSATDPNGHPAGLAADFMVPLDDEGFAQGQRLADYAQQNADQLGIDYIIWAQEIWSVARAEEGWRAMEDRGDPTQNHFDHVHINVLPDANAGAIGDGAQAAAPGDPNAGADCPVLAAGESSGTTVATLNLLGAGHTGPGGRPGFAPWPERLERGMQALQGAGVSIAGLQEVHAPQAEALSSSPRYTSQWGIHPRGGPAQNRVVWNKQLWEPVNRRTVNIPYFRGVETPMPLVKLKSRMTQESAWVWSVHNPADTIPGQIRHRREALRRQLTEVQRLQAGGDRVILVGDFNDAGDGAASSHCRLTPTMTNAFGSGGPGECGKPAEAAPVDHIYGAAVAWVSAQVVETVKRTKISDHPLVVASTMSMGMTAGPGADGLGGGAGGLGGGVVHPMSRASSYSTAHSYGDTGSHWANAHTGEDFSAACGEPVVASHAGTVAIHTDQSWAGPELVVIETGQDQVATWYAHMQQADVDDGTAVQPGQVIGQVGTEGNSTGCHLHFEVHPKNGGYDVDDVDPLEWLEGHGVSDEA